MSKKKLFDSIKNKTTHIITPEKLENLKTKATTAAKDSLVNLKTATADIKNKASEIANPENINAFKSKATSMAKGTVAATIAAAENASTWLSETSWIRSLNENFTSAVSKAMDEGFKIGSIDPQTGLRMMPNNHRILDDGHTINESLRRAFEIGDKEGQSSFESFIEWGKAYVTDLSSPAGMPLPFADSIYSLLRGIGIPEEVARDLVTVNGQEAISALLSGTIAAVALVFAWKEEDKVRFSESLGAIGLTGIIALNPVTAMIAVMGLALGYQKHLIEPEAIKRGGLVSAIGLGVSVLIPGPILLGAVPAFVLSAYVNKKLDKQIPVTDQIKAYLKYIQTEEFRQTVAKQLTEVTGWVNSQIDKAKTKMAS